jgi:hypothetical protein
MVFALLVGTAVLAAEPIRDRLAPPDLDAYERASARVGRDADAHVKLALWCEAHGLQAERMKHLAIAVMTNPAHAAARGLMGLVAYHGRWQRPDAVGRSVREDAELGAVRAEYAARRDKAPRTADDQWKLALWCEENGLKPEAEAHLAAVVRIDPTREAAWKKLGCKKHHGRWMTDEQADREKAELEAQKQADRTWRPRLEKWRGWLDGKAHAAEAEQALSELTDRRAVPSVMAVFGLGNARRQGVAVGVLGQIDDPSASRALAWLAISGRSADVRRVATEILARRDPREYAGQLIALLRDPVPYEVRPVGGPGSPGVLFVHGQRYNVERLYAPPPMPCVAVYPTDTMSFDSYGLPVLNHWSAGKYNTGRITADRILQQVPSASAAGGLPPALMSFLGPTMAARLQSTPGFPASPGTLRQDIATEIQKVAKTEHKAPSQFGFGFEFTYTRDTQVPIGQMMLEAQKSAVVAQAQLQADIAAVETFNRTIRDDNEQVAAVLDQSTGEHLGADRKGWESWWTNQLGYAYRTSEPAPVPTMVENVPLAYTPQPVPVVTFNSNPVLSGFTRMSCFGAGTLVRTLDGLRAIETLEVGDQVLTQDLTTGGLGYQPILVVHHNPPSPTFLIKLKGETIVSSPFHRFWEAGRGWVMARDMKPGATLRTLGGLATVDTVETGPVQKVYNLDVASDHDFFVGEGGTLVHDNTLPDLRQEPFDRGPSLAAASPAAHD